MEFISKWVLDGATGRQELELDEIRSEYPPVATNSGYYATVGDAGSAIVLLSVPSQTRFKLRTILIDRATTPAGIVRFYTSGSAASCAQSLLAFHVGGSQTELIELKGITIDKDLWISHLYSNIQVRVAGLLVASGPL